MSDQPSTAIEMLNALIRDGYITPVPDPSGLMMPTAYRSVPSFTSSGTAPAAEQGQNDAQLDHGDEGDLKR